MSHLINLHPKMRTLMSASFLPLHTESPAITGVTVEKGGIAYCSFFGTLARFLFQFFFLRSHALAMWGVGRVLRNLTSRLKFCAVAAR